MKIVVTHHNADLDALASTIAASRLFKAHPIAGSVVAPPVKRFLALHKDFFGLTTIGEIETKDVSEIIVVDVRDSRRLQEYADIFEARPLIRVIDHHPASEFDIASDDAQIEAVGACTTLLVERLINAEIPISPAEATLYMLGIYSDTGRLSFSSTQPRDIHISEHLLRRGANLRVVNRFLRRQYSEEQAKLLVECMASLQEESVHQVEFAFTTARAPKFVHGAASVIQQVLEFGGHDAVFGVIEFEKNRRVQIIGRSRVSYVDMGEILGQFGGGGHRGAAAASVKGKSVEEVVLKIKEILYSRPPEPTRVSEIMSSPVLTLDHATPLEEALEFVDHHKISGAPILRLGEICGIVSRRDLKRAQRSGSMSLPVSSHMTHNVAVIPSREPVEDALTMMLNQDVGRLPVVDDSGHLVGIISRSDLIRTLYMKHADESEVPDV